MDLTIYGEIVNNEEPYAEICLEPIDVRSSLNIVTKNS